MAKAKRPQGRPRAGDDLQTFLMMRAHYEDGLPFSSIAPIFGVSKSTAHRVVQEMEEQYPEFKQFLMELAEGPEQPSRTEAVSNLLQQKQVHSEQEANERFQNICKDLAKAIEETVAHLLDMSPDELKNMKTEHKLRHIPELVKTSRLLRDQSTENVQKISLVKAVSIATARRKARERTE